jgi:hypothetical protein
MDRASIRAMVLGSLRYLGRGFKFDDLEEATFISESSHRFFVHEFIQIGSTLLFDRWVCMLSIHKEIMDCMCEFNQPGFPGCISISDAMHNIHEKCHSQLKNLLLGAKSSMDTKAFNIVFNNRQKVLNTTVGLPGRWNDKTVTLF